MARRFPTTWCNRSASPVTTVSGVMVRCTTRPAAAIGCPLGHCRLRDRAEVDRSTVEVVAPRLGIREVREVGDHAAEPDGLTVQRVEGRVIRRDESVPQLLQARLQRGEGGSQLVGDVRRRGPRRRRLRPLDLVGGGVEGVDEVRQLGSPQVGGGATAWSPAAKARADARISSIGATIRRATTTDAEIAVSTRDPGRGEQPARVDLLVDPGARQQVRPDGPHGQDGEGGDGDQEQRGEHPPPHGSQGATGQSSRCTPERYPKPTTVSTTCWPSAPSLWRRFFTCESTARSYPSNVTPADPLDELVAAEHLPG